MKKKRIFHVISNTHWDREWRFPFQKNRQMLVEMMDRLLEILEKEPEYRAFHLDSQTVVLEDYLAIRPQKRELIVKLVQEKRLLIGPWFILPDEFQVGGETLIRNLLLGHRIGKEFGHVMKVGYSPFSWGQISQLPQIYKQFGIDVVMFYRGINSLDSPGAEFIWEGADGTRVLASRFSTMPRYNFYFYIYRPVVHDEKVADVEYHWTRGGLPFHFADAGMMEEDYALLKPVDAYHEENLKPAVEAIIRDQADDFTTPHIFWAEGHDSSGPNVKTVQIIRDIRALLPEDRVIHSTLEEYADGLKKSVDVERLPVVKGERRSSQYDRRSGNLYGYTISARMYLKQENFRTEKWIQFYAEPFNTIAGLLGMDTDDRYLDTAWHLLLQNSAHDSIGGCSLDEVHEDMMSRYKQAQEIARGVFSRACKYIAERIDLRSHPDNSIHLVAVNPTTYVRDEVVEAFIDVPQEADQGGISIADSAGKEVSMQLLDVADAEPVLEQMIDRPMYFRMKRYHAYLELNRVPSMGFKTVHVRVGESAADAGEPLGSIEGGLPVLENAHLRVRMNRNGTLDVLDRQNNRSFSQIAYFYDEGEAGHAWVHKAVEPFMDTRNATPNIELVLNGPLIAICRIRHEMEIPADLSNRKEGGKFVTMPIELDVILRKHSKHVEFNVRLTNPAESHRLRMMFPMGIPARYSYGEGQFDVVARPIARPDTRDWIEQPMVDYPLHHFVDVSDGERGAAIMVEGLKEYEVFEDGQRTTAITLFRAFTYVIQPSSVQDYSHQKGSQCLGMHAYRLAFYPHVGDWAEGLVYPEALRFNNELRLLQIGRAMGELASETSFLSVEPENLILSCLKLPEDRKDVGAVLRVYNPGEGEVRGGIRLNFPVQSVEEVTLEEKAEQKVNRENINRIICNFTSKKIVILRITSSV